MEFFKKIFNKFFGERRLRFDITTIFTILLAATSFFIISYTYIKVHKSILKFAEMTIFRAGSVIYEKITCFSKEYQEIPQACDSLIVDHENVSENNTALVYYLQKKLEIHPNIFSIYYGFNDGCFFNIENVSQTKQKTYYSDSNKPIPPDTSFVIETITATSNPQTRVRKYIDKDFKVLAEENIYPIGYDPRVRPWYIGAMNTRKVFWTKPYLFKFPPIYGVTVSGPFYSDIDRKILGIVGVDLSVDALSDFVKKQEISKNGKAFVIDRTTGEIVLPSDQIDKNATPLQLTILKDTFDNFKETKQNSFVQEFEFGKYLVSIFEMPESFNDRWLVAIVAPLDDFFAEIFQTQKIVIFVSLIIFLISSCLVVIFSRKISRPITTLANEVDKITNFEFSSPVRINSKIKEIKILDASVAALREAIQSFSKYVPKEIVRKLIKQGKGITIGGEKKQIVVMFSDIENFTPIAEKNSADKLMTLLEEYFDPMSKIILESQGTIDKYIGDSIMAFWGAPEDVSNPWQKACRAALKCLKLNHKFDAERVEKNLPSFPTRYGLSIGQAIVGNIGTEERINYTALGDIVNTASRLQSTNKIYSTSILITEELNELVKDQFVTRPIDEVVVKGKEIKIKIFELLGEKTNGSEISASTQDINIASMTTEALADLKNNAIEAAIVKFKKILEAFPKDGVAIYWLNKLTKAP